MWVRGLCAHCNSRAGLYFDTAYADFAKQVRKLTTRRARELQLPWGDTPAVLFAPGLVSRSILFGMFAIHPRLRLLFPELAADLLSEVPGEGPIRWPDRLSLRVGLSDSRLPASALLTSGIWSMRVLNERVHHSAFADVVFPPLTWSITPRESNPSASRQFGPEITDVLPDVSDWVRYGRGRTAVDLRNIVRSLPALPHPALVGTGDWVELLSAEGDAQPVVMFGRL